MLQGGLVGQDAVGDQHGPDRAGAAQALGQGLDGGRVPEIGPVAADLAGGAAYAQVRRHGLQAPGVAPDQLETGRGALA